MANGNGNHNLKDLARQITELREGLGLTQQELARKMRTSQQAISRLEQGDYSGYTLRTLQRLAEATHTELSVMFMKNDREPFHRHDPVKYQHTLYDPRFEHDSCGVGFVASIAGDQAHDILEMGIQSVVNVTHRGAVSADAKTGDGAGILVQLGRKFFLRELAKLSIRGTRDVGRGTLDVGRERKDRSLGSRSTIHDPRSTDIRDLAVGMVFLPGHDAKVKERARQIIEEEVRREGLAIFGWRKVPTDPSALGQQALKTRPDIEQLFVGRTPSVSYEEFERVLYLIRCRIESKALEEPIEGLHIPSFSCRTIVYKGLLVAPQLKAFYQDLSDPDFETAFTLFHQRYSTNTFPDWVRAQPFRMLGHNGEINTLQGNQNWMRAREPELHSTIWGDRLTDLYPIIHPGGSDSQNLDNVLEFLVHSGRGILHAMMMLVPEAWENMPHMDPELKSFYEYHACLSEPWDGPAALAFTDGRWLGAALDRNGLRPARYEIRDDGIIIMGSEVGIVPVDEARIVEKGRLGPGQMIAVDLAEGRLYKNVEIKSMIKGLRPYGDWVRNRIVKIDDLKSEAPSDGKDTSRGLTTTRLQQIFGFSPDDLKEVIKPMVTTAKEAVFSMGDDTPLAVLSEKPRLLYTYFKQRFAQVTNPAIDPEREELVMSVNMYLGSRRSLLEETPDHAHLVELESPVLTAEQFGKLKGTRDARFRATVLKALFEAAQGPEGLEGAVDALCQAASRAVDDGFSVIILSDRGVDQSHAPIPMLLTVAACHHALIRAGKRMKCSLVVESGEPRDVHHFAILAGYGASAIYPYLAYESVLELLSRGEIKDMTPEEALRAYRQAVRKGFLKIMSKMGISTLSSYQGAQIFEAVGIGQEAIDRYFTGTSSPIGGIGLPELAEDVLHWHRTAFREDLNALEVQGHVRYRRGGEYHAYNPEMIDAFHAATRGNDPNEYKRFSELVRSRPPTALRDLLEFKKVKPIPIEEVEPVDEICKKFNVSGMSHGALSREAHEQLAIAMNRLGAKSSSGEGGEDPGRYKPRPNGDWPNSAIKQVASGRFGVTIQYLTNSKGLEIKISQGSKPGEGGQLPGKKVTEEIAANRHTQPGLTLISPPPHHDIYSIEDLSQLIYDLKQANPEALITVKLVSEAGVGTVAAGVAKAYADVILISGHDGGTGASPYSSIKHAGTPWEMGLAETHQILVLNRLRERVTLRTDGGMKTGRDVVIAAIMGAEEFGFGTAAVLSTGCVMARQCHLNTCPTGVATQRPDLRAKFEGRPEHTINFFHFVAQEAREIMARLGARRLEDLCGRTDLVEVLRSNEHAKRAKLDLSRLLARMDPKLPQRHLILRNDRVGDTPLDDQIIRDAAPALTRGEPVRLEYPVRNTMRAIGTKLSYTAAKRFENGGLQAGTIEIHLKGSAGQSLGAFLIKGVRIFLEGEANDYVGKGLSGGEIIVRPPAQAGFATHENAIIGNTVLYGATSGELYAAGRAGERFCVRNSGGLAVVEGIGDHGCEYMTGGTVVVLGEAGRNFGAGMTGGLAFVLDERGELSARFNPQLVLLERLSKDGDIEVVRRLIERHGEFTESPRARTVLDGWEEFLPLFWKVIPKEVKAIEAQEAPEAVKV
ncbi:MAG: glutamate synthase large subunit [Candidatus Omnitrophica bacterium]|nr:glutamate synthase large subunit [Candidatus Omnitrophota bacterium]